MTTVWVLHILGRNDFDEGVYSPEDGCYDTTSLTVYDSRESAEAELDRLIAVDWDADTWGPKPGTQRRRG